MREVPADDLRQHQQQIETDAEGERRIEILRRVTVAVAEAVVMLVPAGTMVVVMPVIVPVGVNVIVGVCGSRSHGSQLPVSHRGASTWEVPPRMAYS